MPRPWSRPAVGAFAALSVAGVASPLHAAAPADRGVRLAWSTYLRAGPAQTASAIAELEHDTPVVVASCGGRWCRVTAGDAQGYVDRDALDLPRTSAPVPPARTNCVTTGQADNRGPIPTRFCSAAATPAPAR